MLKRNPHATPVSGWVWGDAGAYYIFIDTDRWAESDFTKLDASFENH